MQNINLTEPLLLVVALEAKTSMHNHVATFSSFSLVACSNWLQFKQFLVQPEGQVSYYTYTENKHVLHYMPSLVMFTSLHSEVLHWKCSQGSISHFVDSSGFGSPQWLSLTVAALSSPPLLSQRFFQRHTTSLFIQPSPQRLSHLPHSFVCHSYWQLSTWHGRKLGGLE